MSASLRGARGADAISIPGSPARSTASDRPLADRRQPMHAAAPLSGERVAAMHRAAVVPDDEVADAPLLRPDVLGLRSARPQPIEHRLALGERKSRDVSAEAPPQVERLARRYRMRAHDGVLRSGKLARIAGPDVAIAGSRD